MNFAGEVDQIHVPDPVKIELTALRGQLEALEKRLMEVKCVKDERDNGREPE